MGRNPFPATTFPQQVINVADESAQTVFLEDILPLRMPIFVIRAQKGRFNTPVFCADYNAAVKEFGAETFNLLNDTYFSNAAFYIRQVFANTGSCWIVRVADGTPLVSNMVIELGVQPRADIPVYEVDAETGLRTVGESGDYVEVPNAVRDGLRLSWHIRVLGENESATAPDTRPVSTTETNGSEESVTLTTTYYPMFVLTAKNAGVWGDNLAVSLSWNATTNNVTLTDRLASTLYTLAPVQKDYSTETINPIYDNLGSANFAFSVKPNVVDPDTTREWSLASIINNRYAGNYSLPFDITPITANFVTVGNLVIAAENARLEAEEGEGVTFSLTDAYEVNLVSGRFANGKFYESIHVITSTYEGYDAVVVRMMSGIYHYLDGGSDGTISDAAIDTQVKDFFELDINPTIVDVARYPFNVIYDTGYSLLTKKAIISFTGMRHDVKAVIATQIASQPANSQATDLATGADLSEYAQLIPESLTKNTGACRIDIFTQNARAYNSNQRYFPMTLWACVAHAKFQSGQYIDQEATGLPNGLVEIFDPTTFNWVPSADDQKAATWDARLNYAQYVDRNRLFVPAVRTVYNKTSSVLSRSFFVDAVTFVEQALYLTWATFSDVAGPWETIQANVVADAEARVGKVLNNRYTFTIRMYRTADEEALGDVGHLEVVIYNGFAQRIQVVDIICRRENTQEA